MGKTVPSFRMALEFEFERWKGFRKALTSEEDREAFEELMDMCRNNAMAAIILLGFNQRYSTRQKKLTGGPPSFAEKDITLLTQP